MKQKKVNSLLKGVAGVGAALGGAAAFTDADVVYADELEGKKGNEGGEETILTQAEASEHVRQIDDVYQRDRSEFRKDAKLRLVKWKKEYREKV